MSEYIPKSSEQKASSHERLAKPTHHEVGHKKHESTPEASRENTKETLYALRKEVSKEALTGKEVRRSKSESEQPKTSQPLINKELKGIMFERTLTRIQKELSPGQRTLSKIVHKKPIEALSSAGEKTIARPIGLLGGGLLALIGSMLSSYLSNHFGMKYNLLLFAFLFTLGYLIATILEMIFLLTKRARR